MPVNIMELSDINNFKKNIKKNLTRAERIKS